MATSTYCDPLSGSSTDECNFPDPNVLDLRKGSNPQFLAYQTNRLRFQRVQQLNEEIRECDDDLSQCNFTPGGANEAKIDQQLSDQQMFDDNGVPTGLFTLRRRAYVDYAASRDVGQNLGEERNNRLFRRVQRDDRQCTLYGTRCGVINNDGSANPSNDDSGKYSVSTIFGSSNGWKTAGAGPSWEQGDRPQQARGEPRGINTGYRGGDTENSPNTDRPTRGYEDRR
mgnify:CR=1 FL=1